MANENRPTYLINALCTAFAVLILHIHQIWPTLVQDMNSSFSGSPDHLICWLLILKYMAADCDNESIVIEESIRESFFHYLDNICPIVFD